MKPARSDRVSGSSLKLSYLSFLGHFQLNRYFSSYFLFFVDRVFLEKSLGRISRLEAVFYIFKGHPNERVCY